MVLILPVRGKQVRLDFNLLKRCHVILVLIGYPGGSKQGQGVTCVRGQLFKKHGWKWWFGAWETTFSYQVLAYLDVPKPVFFVGMIFSASQQLCVSHQQTAPSFTENLGRICRDINFTTFFILLSVLGWQKSTNKIRKTFSMDLFLLGIHDHRWKPTI